jgi:hypothetical protein
LASRPVMLLGNIASIILTIAGILQALSWTIAGAAILAILSITTLVPTRLGSGTTGARSPNKKISHSTTTETRTSREKSSEKQTVRPHQTPSRSEQRPSPNDELARTLPSRTDSQKVIPPKITPPKAIPTSVSPAKPASIKSVNLNQETVRPVSIGTSTSAVGTSKPAPAPPKMDPNTRIIAKGDYGTYDVELSQRAEVTCEVTATALVNVYLMDEDNLNSLDMGEEFWSESGEEGVQKATLHFVAPRSGKWFLVVENVDSKEVSAVASIRKIPPKTSTLP